MKKTIGPDSLRKFDDWLLHNSTISQDERELVVEIVGEYVNQGDLNQKCVDCTNTANSPDKRYCWPHYSAHNYKGGH